MGVNVYAIREWPDAVRDPFKVAELRTLRGASKPVRVEMKPACVMPDRRWPEVIIWSNGVEHGDGDHIGFHPNELRVRIHGRTICDLMDALIENPTTRRYLESGVDHFRASASV